MCSAPTIFAMILALLLCLTIGQEVQAQMAVADEARFDSLESFHPIFDGRFYRTEPSALLYSPSELGHIIDRSVRQTGPLDSSIIVQGWIYETLAPVLSSPRLADLDGDGVKDIIMSTYAQGPNPYEGGVVYAIDMHGNDLPGWPIETAGPIPASPAIADIDNNGDMEVVVGDWLQAHVWNHDGTVYPGWPKNLPAYPPAAVVDLDDDGDLEIIYPSENHLYVWHHDGSLLPGWPFTTPEHLGSPSVADVDGDGVLEIVAGTYRAPASPDPFEVYLWEIDGSVAPGFPVSTSGAVKAAAALGDVDADGDIEIVAAAYHSSDDDFLYVWDSGGNPKPGWPLRASCIRLSSPGLGDLDGDGDLEIVIGGLNLSVLDEEVFAFHHDGTDVTGWPVILDNPAGSGNIRSSPIIADIDGSPELVEVLVKAVDHVFAFHSDGAQVTGFPYFISDEAHLGTFSPSPAVGDLDSDGDAEFVLVSNFGKIVFFEERPARSKDHAGTTQSVREQIRYGTDNFWPMFKHDPQNTGYILWFQRGDADGDGVIEPADIVYLIDYLFRNGDPPDPLPAGDCNCDGSVAPGDVVYLINYLFRNGPPPSC